MEFQLEKLLSSALECENESKSNQNVFFVFDALTIFLMLTIFYSPEFFPLLQEFGQKLPFPTSLQQSLSDNPTCFSSVYSKYRIYSKDYDDDGFEKTVTVICPN